MTPESDALAMAERWRNPMLRAQLREQAAIQIMASFAGAALLALNTDQRVDHPDLPTLALQAVRCTDALIVALEAAP